MDIIDYLRGIKHQRAVWANIMRKEIESRISQLDKLIEEDASNEELWVERGALYWKLQDWKHCIEDYDRAIGLNPRSRAVELRQMAMHTIAFYHKDRYNP